MRGPDYPVGVVTTSLIPPAALLETRVGHVVKRRYRIDALIGAGGQGAVYRARDLSDGDDVAVKVLHDEVDRDPTARERLLREAEAMMVTRSTDALDVLDTGFTPDGRLCIVTELMIGEDLEDALLRREAAGDTFRPDEVPVIFEPIVRALEHAHAAHIVHRDLKPSNVFLDRRRGTLRVRLMDFGFARFARRKRLTAAGFVAGSPSYIAPEIAMELPVTESADVYALSAMMFRALGRRVPFVGEGAIAVLRAAMQAPRPSLHALRPDLPARVDDWVEHGLAAKPEERFATARATYAALCSVLGVR